jgi:protein CMS1
MLTRAIAKSVVDTSSWEKPRTMDNMASFVKHVGDKGEKLEDAVKENGCPHTIVIAAAGLRAADLTRALRSFQSKTGGKVAKLFAKHIKLKEASEECKKIRYAHSLRDLDLS